MAFFDNPVGRKMVVAISGQMLVLFVVLHLAGNCAFFSGRLNVYAAGLHALPFLLWPFRLALIFFFALHLVTAVALFVENRQGRACATIVVRHRSATFASKTMMVTGLFVGVFLVHHLLHFTFSLPVWGTVPGMPASHPDVAAMLVRGLAPWPEQIVYVVALGALMLHLFHGMQSALQSLGVPGGKSLPAFVLAGKITAVLIFLGYLSIPMAIALGRFSGALP